MHAGHASVFRLCASCAYRPGYHELSDARRAKRRRVMARCNAGLAALDLRKGDLIPVRVANPHLEVPPFLVEDVAERRYARLRELLPKGDHVVHEDLDGSASGR